MIRWLAAIVIAIAASGHSACIAQSESGAAQLDPRSLALAGEILDIAYPPEQRRAMLSGAAETMTAQARTAVLATMADNLDDSLRRIIERHLDGARASTDRSITEHTPALFAAMARAYARQFTHDDLVAIRAFVATPAGRRYFQQASTLLADPDVAQANTAYMRSVFSSLEPIQTEMRRDILEYLRSRRGRR